MDMDQTPPLAKDVVDIVANAELLDPVEIESERFAVGDGPVAIDVRIEDGAVLIANWNPSVPTRDAAAAIEIAVTEREAIARRNAFTRLAIVGVAKPGGQPRSAASTE